MRGAALSGIAAENLESGSGIASRTIASLEHHWAQGRELLGAHDVLVIDEAGMIGSRKLERVLGEAERCSAKVVLVGDPEQLQAIEAGAAFRSLTEQHSHVEISEVRRQRERWQQQATRELSGGRAGEALDAYRDHGMVHAAETRDRARTDLIEGWTRDRAKAPEQTRIILTHTNDEVRTLNGLARGKLREAGDLGEDVSIQAERGKRDFACGDRGRSVLDEHASQGRRSQPLKRLCRNPRSPCHGHLMPNTAATLFRTSFRPRLPSEPSAASPTFSAEPA